MPRTLLVVAGGSLPPPLIASIIPNPDLVVCADSGVDNALALGYSVDVAVGDFDSVSATGLATAERSGALVERHSIDKDETDLELALTKAITYMPDLLVVIGLDGGRVDHYLANLLLLGSIRLRSVEVDAYVGDAKVSVVHDTRTISGRIGEIVSLLPIGSDATGVTTSGLAFGLENETLAASSPRGVSNSLTTPLAKISITSGTVLAIQPDRLRPVDGSAA